MSTTDEEARRAPSSDRVSRILGSPVRQGALAFLLFLVLTLLIFALPVITQLRTSCVGACVRDFKLYIWSLDWMLHALSHGIDPFHTQLLWAPTGTSLTWVTTLPMPALAMLPITATLGPVVAANVLLILAPTLAGWAMYLVCRQITHRFLPAVFGGAVFALSTYVGQLMRAQLNLLLMFWAPLAVYLFLRHLSGSLSRRAFVILLTLVLLGEFLTSTEVFAMMTFSGVVTFAVFWLRAAKPERERLLESGIDVVLAYGVTAVLLSPLLVRTLLSTPTVVLRPTEQNSADLLSFFVPGVSTGIGGGALSSINERFLDPDNFAYVGIVFLAIVVAFAVGAARRRWTWPLVGMFLAGIVLSIGPRLHILGERNLWMPGFIVGQVPLLQHAVPVRWVMYAWMALAVIVAIWLAEASSRGWWRYALVALGIVMVLPSQHSTRDVAPVYHETLGTSPFFSDGAFRESIGPETIVLAIPRAVGDEMLWQVRSGMAFRLASAYIGPTKPKNGLGNLSQEEPPPDAEAFVAALHDSQVEVIVADWPMSDEWRSFLEGTSGSTAVVVGDIAMFRVSSAIP